MLRSWIGSWRSLGGVVAPQAAVVAVFKRGGKQVETFDEVGATASSLSWSGRGSRQRTPRAVGRERSIRVVHGGAHNAGQGRRWSLGRVADPSCDRFLGIPDHLHRSPEGMMFGARDGAPDDWPNSAQRSCSMTRLAHGGGDLVPGEVIAG